MWFRAKSEFGLNASGNRKALKTVVDSSLDRHSGALSTALSCRNASKICVLVTGCTWYRRGPVMRFGGGLDGFEAARGRLKPAASGWISCTWPSHIDDWMNQNLTRYFMNVNENLTVEIERPV
jgi:hypothetical protein